MSIQKLSDTSNTEYVSGEETDSLLMSASSKSKSSILRQIKMNSANGPTSNQLQSSSSTASNNKPTLIRQDCTSTYLTSPQLSQKTRLGSDESGDRAVTLDEDVEQGLRTAVVPDNGLHPEDQEHQFNYKQQQRSSTPTSNLLSQQQQQQATISIANLNNVLLQAQDISLFRANVGGTSSYQNVATSNISPSPTTQIRCRACRNCNRRASTTPLSSMIGGSGGVVTAASVGLVGHMNRSVSRDSVKSALQQHSGILGGSTLLYGGSSNLIPHTNIPPVLITSSPPNGSRIIRQSSQPESSSNMVCYGIHTSCGHSHTVPNVSLRQLRDSNNTDGFAGIAADSLKINGGMKPFKQVSHL